MRVALVAVFGAAGAVARYGVGRAFGARTFPWATLTVNLLGSFALGVLLGAAIAHHWSDIPALAIGTGFLGAFTTFSTFSYETWTFARTDRVGMAATYVAASLAGGLLATAGGWFLGRRMA